ncbi:hypothetical protein BGX33_009930, partial [Mortierella sp. NVP41]
ASNCFCRSSYSGIDLFLQILYLLAVLVEKMLTISKRFLMEHPALISLAESEKVLRGSLILALSRAATPLLLLLQMLLELLPILALPVKKLLAIPLALPKGHSELLILAAFEGSPLVQLPCQLLLLLELLYYLLNAPLVGSKGLGVAGGLGMLIGIMAAA